MRYLALATDYDGTLATDDTVAESTVNSLRCLRESGCRLILVTGRELADLLVVFPHLDLFDQVVVENGGVLFCPTSQEERPLGASPPARLVEALQRRGVSFSAGRVIVATWRSYQAEVCEAIRESKLDWEVIFNKNALMVLPPGVNKGTGLRAALEPLHLRPRDVVGIGDAENDLAFLRLCGLSVAVANALPSVQESADITTAGARGQGVVEAIERLVASDLPPRAHR